MCLLGLSAHASERVHDDDNERKNNQNPGGKQVSGVKRRQAGIYLLRKLPMPSRPVELHPA
jgi:hypothetical protein